jgi:hypothetical protein
MREALLTTIVDLGVFLDSQGAPFAIIGGIAVALHGEPRHTMDVDAVIDVTLERAVALLHVLEGSSFEPLFPDAAAVVRASCILPLRHRATGVTVDLAVGLSGFEQQLIARARRLPAGGATVPVATAEDLIVLKLIAGRPRDVDDVRGIVSKQADTLDWNYLSATGAGLQTALAIDLLPELERLRRQRGA